MRQAWPGPSTTPRQGGRPRRDRRIATVYAAAITVTGFALVDLRFANGQSAILWLISVVVVSDVAGYFAGRILGGPKFWPAVSPKKTWSGTVAGWVGAALVGLVVWLMGHGGPWLVLLSPVIVSLTREYFANGGAEGEEARKSTARPSR